MWCRIIFQQALSVMLCSDINTSLLFVCYLYLPFIHPSINDTEEEYDKTLFIKLHSTTEASDERVEQIIYWKNN